MGAVGVVSLVISLAELLAEGASAGIVDRLGKRRSVLGAWYCTCCPICCCRGWPGTLRGALIGVFLMILAFEFSVVSLIPLVSEIGAGGTRDCLWR